MAKTFAQYLIDSCLPSGMAIEKPMDKSYMSKVLTEVARKHEAEYDRVVTQLKRLGDRLATLDAVTMGMDEISVPNKKERDAVIKKYTPLIENEKDHHKQTRAMMELQARLKELNMKGTTDDATKMVRSAMGNKEGQLMKLRTSPGVVMGTDGKIVPIVFPKSYAQGLDPVQFWLGAAEARKNIAEGQVNTAKPGELLKIMTNILAPAVVSKDDCGTSQGILLALKDEDISGRYLARKTGGYERNTLVTPEIQQDLLKKGLTSALVRSPQTCQCQGGSVCKKCMGIRNGTGKPWEIGDNAGTVSAGMMGEPLNQMALSSKHATAMAKEVTGLEGEPGFRQFVESPKQYPNRKVLCEVYGVIEFIIPAPQGGKYIRIRETRRVPDRYIVHAMPDKDNKRWWVYHIPPNLQLVEGLARGTEVYPGMELSTGIDNLQDIARLRNLGAARSAAAQNMYDIFKNTGTKLDRRHFELLSRNMNMYVRIEKIPSGFGYNTGETIEYNKLKNMIARMPKEQVPTSKALGLVLAEGVLDLTAGTEIDAQVLKYLQKNDVQQVSIVRGLEVSAAAVPMSRVVNRSGDWVAAMNHRYLKTQLIDAASTGKKSNIHGYNPVTAYAYGTEMGMGAEGKY